jgi:hypothetical protein
MFICSLIVSQALLTSTSSTTFSKAANLFEISVQYYSLPCASFNFLRLNLSIWKSCVVCLLTDSFSLTFCHHQIMVSITIRGVWNTALILVLSFFDNDDEFFFSSLGVFLRESCPLFVISC